MCTFYTVKISTIFNQSKKINYILIQGLLNRKILPSNLTTRIIKLMLALKKKQKPFSVYIRLPDELCMRKFDYLEPQKNHLH